MELVSQPKVFKIQAIFLKFTDFVFAGTGEKKVTVVQKFIDVYECGRLNVAVVRCLDCILANAVRCTKLIRLPNKPWRVDHVQ